MGGKKSNFRQGEKICEKKLTLSLGREEEENMLPAYLQQQLALSDLLAVSINTSNSCSVTNGPRPDRLVQFLEALVAAKALQTRNLTPQQYILAQAAIKQYQFGY